MYPDYVGSGKENNEHAYVALYVQVFPVRHSDFVLVGIEFTRFSGRSPNRLRSGNAKIKLLSELSFLN
jgi:hypothetical protein